MIRVVDIVNFNADASCLPAAQWLDALKGGTNSTLCQWLGCYVRSRRKVVVGFTGATIADLAMLNPEAIRLVNENPDVFEMLHRPFSHDIALLRTPAGFERNVGIGRRVIEKEFKHVTPYYLPPEFMLTNAQVSYLARSGVRGTFVNASRFQNEFHTRVPTRPYLVRGTFSSALNCIPVDGVLSQAYLQSLHQWDAAAWSLALNDPSDDLRFSWRDGESFLFVPNGIDRERNWLTGEPGKVERVFLADIERNIHFLDSPTATGTAYRSYPVHSFSEWIKEFRMLGYLNRLAVLERQLSDFDITSTVLWLQAINSDVFSAVEKDSPVVALRTRPRDDDSCREIRWTIQRSERGFEGEEFLEMLDGLGPVFANRAADESELAPHLQKFRARRDYLREAIG